MLPEMPDRKEMGRYVALGQIGLEMVAPIVVGLVMDHYLGWTPWAIDRRRRPGIVRRIRASGAFVEQNGREGFLPIRSGVPVIRRLLFLVGGSAAFWLLVGLPARHLGGGDSALVFLGTALLLCLVPGHRHADLGRASACGRSPDKQIDPGPGRHRRSHGLRSAGRLDALSVGPVLSAANPVFLIWLVVGYLFTLALDMTLLLAGRPEHGTGNVDDEVHDFGECRNGRAHNAQPIRSST